LWDRERKKFVILALVILTEYRLMFDIL